MRTPGLLLSFILGLAALLTCGQKVVAAPTVNGMALSVTAISLTSSSGLSSTQSMPSTFPPKVPSNVSSPPVVTVSAKMKTPVKMASMKMTMPATITGGKQPQPGSQTQSGTSAPNSVGTPVAPQPAYAVVDQRPDFYYNPPALNFVPGNSYNTGQIGMAVGPGLQPGMVRYVPVGEF